MDFNSLQQVIGKLESLFSTFNDRLFNNELGKPVITVSPDTTRGAYGWCTSWKAWKQGDGTEGFFEINMCAEHLNRPFEQICSTLIHEMVHLLNLQNNVQDTSRSGMYHNKRFKEIAEQHGLSISKNEKYGWCVTTLNSEAAEFIKSTFSAEESFGLYRSKPHKGTTAASSSSRKYVCPICGTIIRATKEVHVTCIDCDAEFEEEN